MSDEPLATFGECGLSIDLQPDAPAPIEGDWIATGAGSRYLVISARRVESARHDQRTRYQMRVVRLAKHCPPPSDVRVIELAWYKRSKAKASSR